MKLNDLEKLIYMSIECQGVGYFSRSRSRSWYFSVWSGQEGDGLGPYYFCLKIKSDDNFFGKTVYGNQQSTHDVDAYFESLELCQHITKAVSNPKKARL